jgi:hypothetical protein
MTVETCYRCGRRIEDELLAVNINLGGDELGLLCFACCDDLEPLSPRDELEERGTVTFEWGGHAVDVEVAE